jgi:hypothetical protein
LNQELVTGTTMKRFYASIGCVLLAMSAEGASPQLTRILPRGGQRGTEMDVTFAGARLKDAKEVILYEKGIEATKIEGDKPEQVKVHFKIAQDCALGEHTMRLRTATGITELRTFWVGPFPSTQASVKPPNASWDTPQTLAMNTTAEGVINNEQVHFYKIDAKKGQRISAEVEGMRLGGTMFDPYLSVVDMAKFEIATSDDTALLKQDPFVSFLAPKDGPFIVEVRESAFGGSGDSHYRLHVGTYPRPTVVYPLGGKVGETLKVDFLGDPSGTITQEIKLPDQPSEEMALYAKQNNEIPPSPNYFRVSPFPNVMQEGEHHDVATAQDAKIEPPLAFNGILKQPREMDCYKFKATKGQPMEISVWARRLRSPLDSVITVWNAKGQYLANNDDSGNPDSYLRFTPPEDGEYVVGIKDHLGAGGPEYAYRIELTTPRPSVVISIPNAGQVNGPTQERQTIPVPRGNRYATLMRNVRSGVNGELTLTTEKLPDGVTMTAEPFRTQTDVTPVVFEAKDDAPIGGKLCDFVAKAAADSKEGIESKIVQQVELVIGQPNNTPYSHTQVHQFAVAVTQEAPFKLSLVQPKAPLVQNGMIKLKIVAVRKPDFKGPINCRMLFDPPGVNAQPVDMAADKNEVEMPISASEGAAPRQWKICVTGTGNVDGPLWVSSQLVDLTVAQPFIGGKVQMAAVEQDSTSQIVCELTQNVKFEGKAKLELLGLPANTTAEPREITAEDTKVVFDLVAAKKATPGQSNSMFVQATIQKDGEAVVQSLAKGGVIRVDPARVAATTKPTQTASAQKPATPAAPKVLTRLEKLRLEQAEEKK